MEEDDTETDMNEEYEDDEDEDQDQEVIAVVEEVEPEGWVKHTKAGNLVWEVFL